MNINTLTLNEYSIEYNIKTINEWMNNPIDYELVLNAIHDITSKMILLSSIYSDTYILSQLSKSEENIIYVGSNHIPFFKGFFEEINANHIVDIDSNNTCLSIITDKRND